MGDWEREDTSDGVILYLKEYRGFTVPRLGSILRIKDVSVGFKDDEVYFLGMRREFPETGLTHIGSFFFEENRPGRLWTASFECPKWPTNLPPIIGRESDIADDIERLKKVLGREMAAKLELCVQHLMTPGETYDHNGSSFLEFDLNSRNFRGI